MLVPQSAVASGGYVLGVKGDARLGMGWQLSSSLVTGVCLVAQ